MLRRGATVGLCILLTGCFSYTLRTSATGDGIIRRGRGAALFWGLKGVRRDAHECRDGIAYSRTYQPWWSVIVATLTFGVVTPWRSQYECVNDPFADPTPMPSPWDAEGSGP